MVALQSHQDLRECLNVADDKKVINCTYCRTYICTVNICVEMDRLRYDVTGLPTEGKRTQKIFTIQNLRCPKCRKMFTDVDFVAGTTGGKE